MFRSVSFAQRFSQFSEVDINFRSEPKSSVLVHHYEEEVITLFYNSMLDLIVDKWTAAEDEKPVQTGNDFQETKDFKEFSVNNMISFTVAEMAATSKGSIPRKAGRPSQVSTVSDSSKTSINKKSRKSSINTKIARKLKNDSSHASSLSAISKDTVRKNAEIGENPVTLGKGNLSQIPTSEIVDSALYHKASTLEWIINGEPENVIIKFKNGNVYRGRVIKKRFDGEGEFTWSDGVVYEGEFKSGEITGQGKMFYAENSCYYGNFCRGLVHGEGTLYLATTTIMYSGNWRNGKKNGKGWILYEPQNWYEGDWLDGIRHGKGLRQYSKSSRYQGDWLNGERHGQGTMVWNNHDYYSGEWKNGTMDGYGEYVWKGFFNKHFVFPLQNTYEGYWINGMRSGMGILHFGFVGGARMAGEWVRNMKHGAGIIVCGNGKTIKGNIMFMYDKPVDMQLFNSGKSLASVMNIDISKRNFNNKKAKGDANVTDPATEDKLCPEHEKDLNRMSMFTEIPMTYSSQINPLRIPVHCELKQVDLKYYLRKVSEKYGFGSLITVSPLLSQEVNIEQDLKRNNILEFEEKKLRYAITYHYLLLQTAYQLYSTVATTKSVQFKVLLVRLFLWQMYLDAGVTEKISLIDIDLLLLDNPNNGLENEHHPFEKIYFWQFIYSIISTAWELYSDNSEEYKTDGILATVLKKFLAEYIEPNLGKAKSGVLREYVNILPIKNMYLLYRGIGEPHTVRTLFCTCLSKFETACDKLLEDDEIIHLNKGVNIVIGRLLYISDNLDIGEKPQDPTAYPLKENVCKNLRLFRKLKARQLIKCISKVCPKVMEDKVIVNMDYKLSFLEFYNILVIAALKIIENAKELEQRLRDSKITDASLLNSSKTKSSKKAFVKKVKK